MLLARLLPRRSCRRSPPALLLGGKGLLLLLQRCYMEATLPSLTGSNPGSLLSLGHIRLLLLLPPLRNISLLLALLLLEGHSLGGSLPLGLGEWRKLLLWQCSNDCGEERCFLNLSLAPPPLGAGAGGNLLSIRHVKLH